MPLTYADGQPLEEADAALLEGRRARLQRATDAWKTLRDNWARRRWHDAYALYWTTAVQMEQIEAVPCYECGGEGSFTVCRFGHTTSCPCEEEVECDDCCPHTPGFWPCCNCGDAPATTLVESPMGMDLFCEPCRKAEEG